MRKRAAGWRCRLSWTSADRTDFPYVIVDGGKWTEIYSGILNDQNLPSA